MGMQSNDSAQNVRYITIVSGVLRHTANAWVCLMLTVAELRVTTSSLLGSVASFSGFTVGEGYRSRPIVTLLFGI